MMKKLLSLLLIGFIGAASAQAEPVIYKVDPVHSGVNFKIRHFINKVPGTFSDFSGTIHFDKENPENSKAEATIQVASVDTRNTDRDAHLQNEDFFKAAQFPLITFESTSWKPKGENTYEVVGVLDIVGQKHPVVLDVEFLGEVEGRGTIRSGWEGTATIDRTNWGITYGTPAVGTEVEIELNIQAHRQATEAAE
jgi:polyisoprenoid-binding protein YceI